MDGGVNARVALSHQHQSFVPGQGPCYRCLYPAPPPAEFAPSCAEAGVLGVLPGIIGSIQALETIKVLRDLGFIVIGAGENIDEARRPAFIERKGFRSAGP